MGFNRLAPSATSFHRTRNGNLERYCLRLQLSLISKIPFDQGKKQSYSLFSIRFHLDIGADGKRMSSNRRTFLYEDGLLEKSEASFSLEAAIDKTPDLSVAKATFLRACAHKELFFPFPSEVLYKSSLWRNYREGGFLLLVASFFRNHAFDDVTF